NFTWNKSLDNVPIVGTPQNPYDARADRGNSEGVREHVFNLAATYPLPLGKKILRASGWAGQMLSGWNLAGLAHIRAGPPFHVTSTARDAGWYAPRADVVGNSRVDHPDIEGWFNPAAFRAPAPFTFGNSARNVLFGPGQIKIDLSMLKDVKVAERYTLQVRAESFNLPNHPSFANPGANVSVPSTLGKIRSTSLDQRAGQFALRLSF